MMKYSENKKLRPGTMDHTVKKDVYDKKFESKPVMALIK